MNNGDNERMDPMDVDIVLPIGNANNDNVVNNAQGEIENNISILRLIRRSWRFLPRSLCSSWLVQRCACSRSQKTPIAQQRFRLTA